MRVKSVQLARKAIVIPNSQCLSAVLVDGEIKAVARCRLKISAVSRVVAFRDAKIQHPLARILALERGLQFGERKHRASRSNPDKFGIQRLVDLGFKDEQGARSTDQYRRTAATSPTHRCTFKISLRKVDVLAM